MIFSHNHPKGTQGHDGELFSRPAPPNLETLHRACRPFARVLLLTDRDLQRPPVRPIFIQSIPIESQL